MSDDDEKNKNYIDRICIGGGALTGAFFALSMAFFFRFNTSVDWSFFAAISFFTVAVLFVAAAILAAKYNRRQIIEPTFSTEAEPRDLSAVFTSCGGFAAGLFLMLALLYGFKMPLMISYSIGLGALFAVLTLFTVLIFFLGSRYYRLKQRQESEGVGMTAF